LTFGEPWDKLGVQREDITQIELEGCRGPASEAMEPISCHAFRKSIQRMGLWRARPLVVQLALQDTLRIEKAGRGAAITLTEATRVREP